MICPECLTWPVTAENELCCKCQREIDSLEPQKPVDLWDEFPPGGVHANPDVRRVMGVDRSSGPDHSVACIGYVAGERIHIGQLVYLGEAQERSAFPDVDQMLWDLGIAGQRRLFGGRLNEFNLRETMAEMHHEIAKMLRVPQHLLHA